MSGLSGTEPGTEPGTRPVGAVGGAVGGPVGDGVGGDDAHLAALLAVLALVRADETPHGTPLQRWRAGRAAALAADPAHASARTQRTRGTPR